MKNIREKLIKKLKVTSEEINYIYKGDEIISYVIKIRYLGDGFIPVDKKYTLNCKTLSEAYEHIYNDICD